MPLTCRHKWQFQATNLGLNAWMCHLHNKSVNDDICSECPDREGDFPKPLADKMDFPSRTDEEIEAVYKVCKACPLLRADKRCKKMPYHLHPMDIVAQHPATHCPEKKW